MALAEPLQYQAGLGVATVIPSLDFEGYSEAGFFWDQKRWRSVVSNSPGLEGVGAWMYSRHPSTRVTCMAWDMHDGLGPRMWYPGDRFPQELVDHVFGLGLIEAHNSFFEYCIWTNVCMRRYNWPPMELRLWRDSMAKCCSHGLPRGLAGAAKAVGAPAKDEDGKKVMLKLSKPRSPSKKDPRQSYQPFDADHAADFATLYSYNRDDIAAEHGLSIRVPDLEPLELEAWKVDQEINARGVKIDLESVKACNRIIDAAELRYNERIREVTSGAVNTANSHDQIKAWLATVDVHTASTDKEHVAALLDGELPPAAREVLDIRQRLGHASVKKARTMAIRADPVDHRIRGLFTFAGAIRTRRWAGAAVQPQNIAAVFKHEEAMRALADVQTGDLRWVENNWGDALRAVSGVLRSLFIAKEGHDLIACDFSAIEAVGLAELAGEQWRRDVFNTHGKIYETSASKMFQKPVESITSAERKRGKVAELASGYGGWVEAWARNGAREFMTERQIEDAVKAWRDASPAIVDFWHDLERAAKDAINRPGEWWPVRDCAFGVFGGSLYAWLPSGRAIVYHHPRIIPGQRFGRPHDEIWYVGVDSQTGKAQWQKTYGGKLCENITQATCRDLQRDAMVRVERAGYPIVLHVHDEIVTEVPYGCGSVEELAYLMTIRPAWAAGWPIRATGWRGLRFRKD